MPLGRTTITLSSEELTQLAAVVDADAPSFASRLGGPLKVERIEQPWFRRHRILEIGSPMPYPARKIHVAAYDGGISVLTARLAHFQTVAAHDPPLDLDDEDKAAAYASSGNAWTREYANGELKIGTFSDIPWYPGLDAVQQKLVDDLAARVADAIAPEQHRRGDDGWIVRSWWVAHRRLIERELTVPRDGQLRRNDTIHAEDLPLPPGNQWRFVNGRYLPVG